ncbi:metallophosphoesterase [Clostridium sp. 19966]|uniref:metallophosphoesterase n=1 Tax=Clostridium sp. 19966 TaxID=2768166 RepID=UPI0028DDE08D|nr:metallophosphoesterase [Clostridium sp. 19966]MDT8718016.1 metallophosphoesterase [Clostridium sp. 19966]
MKFIFISDIHIGTNYPENWYQKSVHQKYLKAILQYIQTNAQEIQDVIMLGDCFDSWMYTPQPQISATVTEIINNNLDVFTRQSDGDFITCMDSIQGNLCYVYGNHDMTIDFNKLNNYTKLQSNKSKQLVCLDRIYSKDGIYAEHGHYYDLFCKSNYDRTNKYQPLPIGYFISRAATLYCQQQLKKSGKNNSSQLDVHGDPGVFSILNISDLRFDGTLAHIIMSTLSKLVGYDDLSKLIFTMPDGTSISAAEVEKLYPNIIKSLDDLTSLLMVNVNNSLNNQGANLCNTSYMGIRNKVVVMGHTHVPVLQKHSCFDGEAIYVNSGFLCPAIPDMQKGGMMTFTEVEQNSSRFTVTVNKVNYPDGSITPLVHDSV